MKNEIRNRKLKLVYLSVKKPFKYITMKSTFLLMRILKNQIAILKHNCGHIFSLSTQSQSQSHRHLQLWMKTGYEELDRKRASRTEVPTRGTLKI